MGKSSNRRAIGKHDRWQQTGATSHSRPPSAGRRSGNAGQSRARFRWRAGDGRHGLSERRYALGTSPRARYISRVFLPSTEYMAKAKSKKGGPSTSGSTPFEQARDE